MDLMQAEGTLRNTHTYTLASISISSLQHSTAADRCDAVRCDAMRCAVWCG